MINCCIISKTVTFIPLNERMYSFHAQIELPRSLPHDKLVHSFQNRQIYPLEGIIVSTHKLSCPTLPPLPFDPNQAPTASKTPPSPHRLFDLQDSLDKLTTSKCISFHSCLILSPSETGFIVSAHRLTNITLLTLIATL